jgi:hypothetical protein
MSMYDRGGHERKLEVFGSHGRLVGENFSLADLITNYLVTKRFL